MYRRGRFSIEYLDRILCAGLQGKVSQTATEYLVLIAVVIVIGLVLVSIIGDVPFIGVGSKGSVSEVKLRSQEIGIENFAFSNESGLLVVKNNKPNLIKVEAVYIGGDECGYGTFVLRAGQSRKINCSVSTNTAEDYEYTLSLNWTDIDSGATYVQADSDVKIVGDVVLGLNTSVGTVGSSTPSVVSYQCSDGVDNDADGYYDLIDPSCDNATDDSEGPVDVIYWNSTTELVGVLASDGGAGDEFGRSVAISGSYAVVGARYENTGGTGTGAAYVFKKNASNGWEQTNKLVASDPTDNDNFGYSVSISGDYLVVGALYEDSGGSDSGAAYVFKRNASDNWNELQKLKASDRDTGDQFGYSVSISGDYISVGARKENSSGSDSGAAYVFKRNVSDGWEEVSKVVASNAGASDEFGTSISISGDYLVVGAIFEDGLGTDAGSSYVFKRNASDGFNEVERIRASDGATNDYFGQSVSISGDYLVVGGYGENAGFTDSGAAFVFKRNATDNWNQVSKIIANDTAANDWFGYSVSISGDYVLVGCRNHDGDASDGGAAYVFKRNATDGFEQIDRFVSADVSADDRFGISVSIDGNYSIVGAFQQDDNGADAGKAYFYVGGAVS